MCMFTGMITGGRLKINVENRISTSKTINSLKIRWLPINLLKFKYFFLELHFRNDDFGSNSLKLKVLRTLIKINKSTCFFSE